MPTLRLKKNSMLQLAKKKAPKTCHGCMVPNYPKLSLSSQFWHRCLNSPFAIDKQHQSSRWSFQIASKQFPYATVPGIIFLCVLFSSKRHRWNKQQDLFRLSSCVYLLILCIDDLHKILNNLLMNHNRFIFILQLTNLTCATAMRWLTASVFGTLTRATLYRCHALKSCEVPPSTVSSLNHPQSTTSERFFR